MSILGHHRSATLLLACLIGLTGGMANRASATDAVRAGSGELSFEQQLGVHVEGIKLAAAGHMVDFRFRVLDPDLTWKVLGVKGADPILVHLATGARLAVPAPAYVGRLAPSERPEKDRVYFVFFSNPGLVKRGDEVKIRFGDVELGPLTVR
jgi:hypothetical protein